mmetsp:Transcript_19652/g.22127  ORF Transcript_19652/g.22127 Transcript_19652/m.22127 type:complete len:737 (-) Transcript_19652:135-2345(-)
MSFMPNSSLLHNFSGALAPIIVDHMIEEVFSAKHICDIATQICVGELYPYESLEECYRILSSVATNCEPLCYDCTEKDAPFQGDTRLCRSLHLTSAQLRPAVHCPHLANVSEKCYEARCPSAQRKPLDEVEQELQPFDPRFSRWMEIVEVVVASILFAGLLAAFAFFRYMRPKILANSSISVSSEPTRRILPSMECAFIMSRQSGHADTDEDSNIILNVDGIDIGGCKLTAIVGPSGCGKSSLMKLLCGFTQPHMKLNFQLQSSVACDAAYTPQSSDMWPRGMKVRDIFLFVCTLHGYPTESCTDCIRILQLVHILDQDFGSLSGGQQQRVHVLACIMRPNPSLLFLDEPISSLDDKNAVAFLQFITNLDMKHAFCISIHQLTSATRCHFDRILEFNVVDKKLVETHCNEHYMDHNVEQDISECDGPGRTPPSLGRGRASTIRSLKAFLFLWFGQFCGQPFIEASIAFSSVLIMSFCGTMSKQALEDEDEDYIPSSLSARIPFLMLNLVSTMVIISTVGASLVFGTSEKALVTYVIQQGDMSASAFVGANLLRFSFYGIMISFLMVITFLSLSDLNGSGMGMVVINCAFFATASNTFSYAIALSIADHFAPQIILLTVLPMTFFSGVFFLWDNLGSFFRVLHYLNPLFYCLHACIQLVLSSFQANCDDTASPFFECAEALTILEIGSVQEISCLYTQIASAILLLVGLGWMRWHLHPREARRHLSKEHRRKLKITK